MKHLLSVILFFTASYSLQAATNPLLSKYKNKVDSITVSKRHKIMRLYSKNKWVTSYAIAIGRNPIGHKQYQGDNRTPEGTYYITDRNPNSSYFLNLHISYPNNKDKANARRLGKIPGGDIKIHGYADRYGHTDKMNLKFGYTWGCIAVTNKDMLEIYHLVRNGAIIVIKP